MMNENQMKLAVMFADVAGSVQLYQTLGDLQARKQIAQCLENMSQIVVDNGGKVVQTIGDELMCQFSNADNAVQAACKIQQALDNAERYSRLPVRIGLHYGDVITEDANLFGDTVNVAARMANIAKARQIITTEQTIKQLSPESNIHFRGLDYVFVKGKGNTIAYQIIWEKDVEMLTYEMPVQSVITSLDILINYSGIEKKMTLSSSPIKLGRSEQCDIITHFPSASRLHAQIECRLGRVILVDFSLNGTYVKTQDGREIHIHREELLLTGEGLISLGMPINSNEDSIYFRITQ